MKAVLKSAVGVVTFVVVSMPASSLAADAKFELGGDPAKGALTFKQMCTSCHGEKGAGDGAAAAAITPKPANLTDTKRAAEVTDEYVYKIIKEGGAANGRSAFMVAWGPALGSDAKVRDVAAFVRSLGKPPVDEKAAKGVKAPKK